MSKPKVKFRTIKFKENDEIGFKGTPGDNLIFNLSEKIEENGEWSGFYVGKTEEQGKGYLVGDSGNNTASLWGIRASKSFNALVFNDSGTDEIYLASGKIMGDDKAKEIKKALVEATIITQKETESPLIITIGAKSYAYEGPESSEPDNPREIVIPWNMVEKFIECRKVKEYTIKDYEISSETELEDKPWIAIKDNSSSPSTSPKATSNEQVQNQSKIDHLSITN